MPLAKLQKPLTSLRGDLFEYSSGVGKLPLGKVDSRLLRCMINSSKGMALHDSTWSKTAASPMQGVTVDLDIRSNAVQDKSGNGNHPTLSNVIVLNGEMQFNGTNSYAKITHNANFETNSFSVHIRFKVNSLVSDLQHLFNKTSTGGWNGYLTASKVAMMMFDSSWAGTNTGAWSDTITVGTVYDGVFAYERFTSNTGILTCYLNGVFRNSIIIPQNIVLTPGDLYLGQDSNNAYWFNGSIYTFQMFDHVLSSAEVKTLYDGRSALYPSQDSLNFTETVTTVKDLQWFIRNPSSIIETAPTVLADDGINSFFTSYSANVIHSDDSTIKMSGANSLKIAATNVTQWDSFWYVWFNTQLNWSAKDVFSFDFYGANSGKTFQIQIECPNSSNMYATTVTDNFTGWRRLTFIILTMTVTGSPDLTKVQDMSFKPTDSGTCTGTWYFDRFIVDVCPSIPVKKLSIDSLYLENQMEESNVASDVIVDCDDGMAAYLTAKPNVVNSDVTSSPLPMKGINCLKTVASGVTQYSDVLGKWFGSSPYKDWSNMEFFSFWMYGSNSGRGFILNIQTSGASPYKAFYDNFTGWKRIVIPIYSMTGVSGVNLAQVQQWFITSLDAANLSGTWYWDRIIVQKGRWAYVEIAVPDLFYLDQDYLTVSGGRYSNEYQIMRVYYAGGYNNTAYSPDGENTSSGYNFHTNHIKFLDNSSDIMTIFGEANNYSSPNSAVFFLSGLKGAAVGRKSSTQANLSMTYNGVGGCRRRIGFAIKMPPTDLTADSTHGINQVKINLEVYVP